MLHQYEHQTFHVPDVGYDIGAYREAASAFKYPFYCFLNSFSEIRADDWLRKLREHASSRDAGIVGATGSFESVYSTALEERRYIDAGIRARVRAALWLQFYRLNFHPFPNPHIRTNGFMLSRDVFVKIDVGRQRRKTEALLFESGRRGMSAQVLALGLRLLVVSATGAAFDVEQWPASNTFRLGDQAGLLIEDNQTRTYANAEPKVKAALTRMAWGRLAESPLAI